MAIKFWTGGSGDGQIATAGNWSDATAPTGGDTLHFRDNAVDVAPGQDSSAATFARVVVDASYTGKIASPGAPWVVAATIVEIGSYAGVGTPTHSGSINIDTDDVASTVYVYDTADESSEDPDRPPVYLKADENTTIIHVFAGNVAIADRPGDLTEVSGVQVGYLTSTTGDAKVSIGQGATVASLIVRSGECVMRGVGTNITQYGGTLTLDTTDSFSNVNVYGGTFYGDQFGTITNFSLTATTSAGAVADFLRTSAARTITNPYMGKNATLRIDTNIVTLTNKIDYLYPVTCVVSGV